MTPEQLAEVQRLRDRKLTPKQIARKLGLRPAEVKSAIQQQATMVQQARAESGELAPLEACFANSDMVDALLRPKEQLENALGDALGLGAVMVVRSDRKSLTVAVFLVDYYCLGVKNAMLHTLSNTHRYRRLQEMTFDRFPGEIEEVSLAHAQAIVLGAVDYAHRLGFEPHEDFSEAQTVLGERLESLTALKFGRNGKPFYFHGPNDNPAKVIQTLDKSVGKGNYDYFLEAMPGL